jgi:hypothetical protein
MRRPLVVLLLASLAAVPLTASAQDPFGPAGPGNGSSADKDESTPDYLKALELQRKGHWKEAQHAFQDLLKKYPNSVHKEDIEYRGGENCYLGCIKTWEGGPPARRIDVAMMGDGYTVDLKDQEEEEKNARKFIDMLCTEAAYLEYKPYFNYYYVRLVSKDKRVDPVYTDAELAKLEKKHKKPVDYSTALDCKAAGPQHQVLADRDLVYQWLNYANKEVPGVADDGLVFAFARFGQLGMGGGGIANVGPPEASVDVHEFGHAFCELLDEYAIQPGPPGFPLRAFNATSDPKDVPWQHFLDKKVKGVGVFEGGATYKTGVWRPAQGCAMNSAGNAGGYCPVCREQCVLHIYRYVSPIDLVSPNPQSEMKVVQDDGAQITVTPMQPMTHDLLCQWYVDGPMEGSAPGPQKPKDDATHDAPNGGDSPGYTNGLRGFHRDGDLYAYPPLGNLSQLGQVVKRKEKEGTKFVFPASKLPPGRWQVNCRVWDNAEWPALKNGPAVLKDPQRLLEERVSFIVTVAPKK